MTTIDQSEMTVDKLIEENATFDSADNTQLNFRLLGTGFSTYELTILWFAISSFLAAYIVCFFSGVPYSSLSHAQILYAIFVTLNIFAGIVSLFSWSKIPTRSIARDSTLFLTISVCSAAIGNSIDFLFWIFNISPFKQSVFTNLLFIFAILFAIPGIHLLGRVCRVEFGRQPLAYYLGIIFICLAVPFLMNPNLLGNTYRIGNFKEFVFGILYSIGIGYLTAISLFLWKKAHGRLFHSARLVGIGVGLLSIGCSIYAGLFTYIPMVEIPSHPVHILLALGYLCVALGIRHTEKIINTIFDLKESKLPPSLPLIEIFGPSQGMAVYKQMESNIKAALEELLRSKAETEIKQRIIKELETEVNLRKETEKALIIEKEKAEEANKTKSQFLAMMSHELKTPLTAIKGYGQLLNSSSGPAATLPAPKIKEIASQIVFNSSHLQSMIDGILRFSQIESGKFNYQIEEFNLCDVVDYIDSLLLQQQQFSSASFTANIPERSLRLNTDRLSLQHILTNLLTNAFKFCHDGKINLEIRRSGRDLFIAVEDTGIGIAAQHVERIFQAFYQISHGNRRKFGGTGLGLSIVKKLTEELRGKIFVTSEPDKGSRFEVILPDIIIEGN